MSSYLQNKNVIKFRPLIWKLAGIVLFFMSQSFDQALAIEKQLHTVAGEMRYRLNDKTHECNFFLNNTPILNIKCEFAYLPEVLSHFRGKIGSFDEVIILQESLMGNACNGGPLHLIALKKSKTFLISGPIDFCGGSTPVIEREGEGISITFPGGAPNRGTGHVPVERWIFVNGQLKKEQGWGVLH